MTTDWIKKIKDAGYPHDETGMTIGTFLELIGDRFIALYKNEMQVSAEDVTMVPGYSAVGQLNETEQMQANSPDPEDAMAILWYELNKIKKSE